MPFSPVAAAFVGQSASGFHYEINNPLTGQTIAKVSAKTDAEARQNAFRLAAGWNTLVVAEEVLKVGEVLQADVPAQVQADAYGLALQFVREAGGMVPLQDIAEFLVEQAPGVTMRTAHTVAITFIEQAVAKGHATARRTGTATVQVQAI